VCFTNPGTSEMHFVAALDEVDGMRCVLCLFEGVVSGAADGYARMTGKPASTLLHLGPGLGNALANIHNARKAGVPMVNIVGDHATYHVQHDAPLTSDIEGVARPMSHWVHTSAAATDIAKDASRAVLEAGHNRIATLIQPADVSRSDNANGPEPRATIAPLNKVSSDSIAAASKLLASAKPSMLLVDGNISAEAGILLGKISQVTGARICTDTFPTRMRRGAGTAKLEKMPYLAELAIDHIKAVEQLILVGAKPPVSFFAYPNVPSVIQASHCSIMELARPGHDIQDCLARLLEAAGGSAAEADLQPLALPEPPTGDLKAASLGQALAHFLPENAIVVDEAATTGFLCYPMTATARQHDWLTLTGGSIGYGLPNAVGAAIACPERKVICVEGDGSAMYTIQALWTMAREALDITVIICNNRKYNILQLEFSRTGARGGIPGPKAASMLNIGNPDMDFVSIAQGMGVTASTATTAEELNTQLKAAMNQRGPCLIDAIVPAASI
jgi:acetolactate synthase-1/2/3 large subunit